MNTESLQITFDRIGTTLDTKFNKKSKSDLRIWCLIKRRHKQFPNEIMGFIKGRFYKNYCMFHGKTMYEDESGRKIILLYDPEAGYLPQLCIQIFPTVKSHFDFKLISDIHTELGFHVTDFKLSVLEISFDNFSERKYANHLWLNSKRYGASDGKNEFEVDYLKIMDDLENHLKIVGTRSYKQFNSYEKDECDLEFERNELIMRRAYFRPIGVETLEDLGKKDVVDKICGSFDLYKFDKKAFERKNGEIGWMKGSSNNYGVKFIAEKLHAEHGEFSYYMKKEIGGMSQGWERAGTIEKARISIKNFKRDYLKELRIAGTFRKRLRAQFKRFFLDHERV